MKKSTFHAVRQKAGAPDLSEQIAQALQRVRQAEITHHNGPSYNNGPEVSLEEFLRHAPEATVKKAFPLLAVFGGKASSSVFRERLGLQAPNAWIAYVRREVCQQNAH